jgi:restriction system protein
MAFWGVRLGRGGQYADLGRERGFIAIGWQDLGDVTWLAGATDEPEARAKLHQVYEAAYSQTGMKASIAEGQVWRFVHEMHAGDVVFVPHAAKGVVHVGTLKGDVQYVAAPGDGCPYRLRRLVDWSADVARKDLPGKLAASLGSLVTVFSLRNRAAEIRAVLSGEVVAAPVGARIVDVVEHVLDRLHGMHPKEFEAFVASYFQAIGYDAEATQYVGDGGIDVAGTLDAEGLAKVLLRVQVKRTKSTVGIDTVLKTRGALGVDEQGAIISLGGFTAQARTEAEAEGKKTIVLVEGEAFVEMLLDHWADLDEQAQRLLSVRPKERLPLRERFVVDDTQGGG